VYSPGSWFLYHVPCTMYHVRTRLIRIAACSSGRFVWSAAWSSEFFGGNITAESAAGWYAPTAPSGQSATTPLWSSIVWLLFLPLLVPSSIPFAVSKVKKRTKSDAFEWFQRRNLQIQTIQAGHPEMHVGGAFFALFFHWPFCFLVKFNEVEMISCG
jgi:hypothetical protein